MGVRFVSLDNGEGSAGYFAEGARSPVTNRLYVGNWLDGLSAAQLRALQGRIAFRLRAKKKGG